MADKQESSYMERIKDIDQIAETALTESHSVNDALEALRRILAITREPRPGWKAIHIRCLGCNEHEGTKMEIDVSRTYFEGMPVTMRCTLCGHQWEDSLPLQSRKSRIGL